MEMMSDTMVVSDEFMNNLAMKAERIYDPVTRPEHYANCKVECIDAMVDVFGTDVVKGFCLGSDFKYLWRRKFKDNEDQDVKKSPLVFRQV